MYFHSAIARLGKHERAEPANSPKVLFSASFRPKLFVRYFGFCNIYKEHQEHTLQGGSIRKKTDKIRRIVCLCINSKLFLHSFVQKTSS